ncbi:hypothetical protein Aab01nite_04230 [Paractinoplanes abujensis]|uniref:Uncharacterized protein n=1 Tax=Paractinoplanes abujensis TaxID=882441 RepID=A0A7W7CR32_9ACTN|nr:hypothetical protein [Actinoplanes abujensis]MBB4691745.1 hypothetical protein [Actinoplanes abujensis]GID16833.1 hypothetical protein Aab01nite_04230 [Actinoplanes abujensis]
MTEDLRALMRAELNSERPPPLGDVVGAAVRDGRRIRRRRRRLGTVGAGVAGLVAVVLFGGIAAHSEPRRPVLAEPALPAAAPSPSVSAPARAAQKSPGSVPVTPTPPATMAPERSLAVHSGIERAAGPRKKATTGAMLHLLTELLPPGRTSHAAVAADEDLHVQIYLDRGDGPGMLRMTMGQLPAGGPRGGTATVSIIPVPDNCAQSYVAVSRWPDGTSVQLDVASCLAGDTPAGPEALTPDEAVAVVADPRWGLDMDADLVDRGNERFGKVPVFAS